MHAPDCTPGSALAEEWQRLTSARAAWHAEVQTQRLRVDTERSALDEEREQFRRERAEFRRQQDTALALPVVEAVPVHTNHGVVHAGGRAVGDAPLREEPSRAHGGEHEVSF